ncbi:MAG: DUF2786 domain-containing protein [Thermodesulfobacteriota bacterium]
MNQADADLGRWTLQLYREHELICRQYGVALPRPLIEVTEDRSRWGSFHSGHNTIRISRKLIAEHAWDVVVEVLKHEMAHQLVHHQGGNDGPPHGPRFRQAADRLGLDPLFAAAAGDLPRTLAADDPAGERLRRRVEKLLHLSTSANEHEALAAMNKAGALILRYNLDQAGEPAGCCYRVIELKRRRVENWQRHICRILMEHYRVEIVLASQYCAADGCEYRTVEVFGTPAAVAGAVHVFAFLSERLAVLWRMAAGSGGMGTGARNSYWRGVLDGFAASLAGARQVHPAGDPAGAGTTLPVAAEGDSRLAAFVRRRHPHLCRRRGRATAFQPTMYARGREDGAALRVRRPLPASSLLFIE